MSTDRTQPIALLGVPLEAGTGRRGAAMGPAALRVAGLAERLEALGWSVTDFGDVAQLALNAVGRLDLPGRAHVPEVVASWVRPLAREARRLCDEGHLPVFMGGDHSLSMGSLAGVASHWQEKGRPLYVLWLDAHADFNTPSISPSGRMLNSLPLERMVTRTGSSPSSSR